MTQTNADEAGIQDTNREPRRVFIRGSQQRRLIFQDQIKTFNSSENLLMIVLFSIVKRAKIDQNRTAVIFY